MASNATLNAKVAAAGLLLGAIALHGFNQLATELSPLRLIFLGALILGAWAFSDQMGLRRPLNRAAFISFMFAMTAIGATIVNSAGKNGNFFLIYAFALLIAMLIWSIAFMHRQKEVRLVGALGAAASIVPLLILILGHVSVAAGAFFGVEALLNMNSSASVLASIPVQTIEALFIVWAAIAAVLLWRGHIPPDYARL